MANGTRIRGHMDTKEVVAVMSDGNPGALRVCIELLMNGQHIDPVIFCGGLGIMMLLDTFGIYGPRIWMLYKDVCGQSLEKTVGLLRACQLGILNESSLNRAIDNQGIGIDLLDILQKTKEWLPSLNIQLESEERNENQGPTND